MKKDTSLHSEEHEIYSILEEKIMTNLQWSIIFFIFNHLSKQSKDPDFEEIFINNWKNFTLKNLVKDDLESINTILNSPKNVFNNLLKNKGEPIDSTEIYQEIYNKVIKNTTNFFLKNTSSNKDEFDS
jgi:hypothetical protein